MVRIELGHHFHHCLPSEYAKGKDICHGNAHFRQGRKQSLVYFQYQPGFQLGRHLRPSPDDFHHPAIPFHNELVVDKLQFYISYLSQGKYNLVDAYGAVPFYVDIDKTKGQLAGTLIGIKFLSENVYQIENSI